jgi:tRNA(Ile)-lysidine synthase
MKINTIKKLPSEIGIAFSGGIDSSVLLHIALKLKRNVTIMMYDHLDEISEKEIEFGIEMSKKYSIPIRIGKATSLPPKGESKEAFWSVDRNTWFHSFDFPIATGHNLNDVAEWYLMTMLNGKSGYLMQYSNKNVIRPLIAISRKEIEEYQAERNIQFITDPTNADTTFNTRNKVRADLLPVVLSINPGFLNTMKRNVIKREKEEGIQYGKE